MKHVACCLLFLHTPNSRITTEVFYLREVSMTSKSVEATLRLCQDIEESKCVDMSYGC
jgi:hypothetical protein